MLNSFKIIGHKSSVKSGLFILTATKHEAFTSTKQFVLFADCTETRFPAKVKRFEHIVENQHFNKNKLKQHNDNSLSTFSVVQKDWSKKSQLVLTLRKAQLDLFQVITNY